MATRTRQIIALGGGGFLMEPENPALDRYVLAQAGAAHPKVCFVPTASGDTDRNLFNFYAAFSRYECRPTHLKLFGRTPDLGALLLQQDVIYVGGGNTKSMLAVWREWGIPEILRQAYDAGVVLAGVSAGAICWFQQGVTDSWEGRLAVLDCLGMLPGSACPHYDGEPERRPAVHDMLLRGALEPGYAMDDGAAVHFRDGRVLRAVASRPKANAFRVDAVNGAVVEQPLPIERLGSSPASRV